jgi:hypothetical protein
VVADKLAAVAPPAGLRETILAGARASRRPRPWWQSPLTLAAAASIALIVTIGLLQGPRLGPGDPSRAQFAEFALRELHGGPHKHDNAPGAVHALAEELGAATALVPAALALSPDDMRRKGCTAFRFAGREVFEICFERDGSWYHLYVMRRDRRAPAANERDPLFVHDDTYAAAVWTGDDALFTLVSRQGMSALRQVI